MRLLIPAFACVFFATNINAQPDTTSDFLAIDSLFKGQLVLYVENKVNFCNCDSILQSFI